jgi:peptidoglycan/xylan/chitin deacetylase (PgdA/CDA1 family)
MGIDPDQAEKLMHLRRIAVWGMAACLLTALGGGRFAAAKDHTNKAKSGADAGGLPTPPGKAVPKPEGPVGNLKVLDWAGFHSALTYTFDDSIPSQIAHYPELNATGVHMTFFLVGASDGNSPVWAQAAKDGHELANHTEHHCHADATGCAWGKYAGSLEAEYDLCTAHIKQAYGVSDVWTTATPYGDMGFDNVAKTRFFLNRGVRGGQIAANDQSDAANLPTFTASAGQKADTFKRVIDADHASGNWQVLLFHSLGGDGGYAPVNIADVIASINHAKAFGDVWIDSFVNVGAYWLGQKAVTDATVMQVGKKTNLSWTLPDHFPRGKYVRVTVTGGKLSQAGKPLKWNSAGYYEVALDPRSLTISR